MRCPKEDKSTLLCSGALTTEDVYFCLKLKDKLKKGVKFLVDTKVPTGHLMHPEAISAYNGEDMLEHIRKTT